MIPMWVYFVVALVIAFTAFAIGQYYPGMGAVFVGVTSVFWCGYVAFYHRRLAKTGCER